MNYSSLGIDRAIALTLINRGWSLISGTITLFFILRELGPVEQGYYYTFNSMLGLQVFFELGLGFVVLSTSSHMMATLRHEGGQLVGDSHALGRLGRFLHDVLLRFVLLSILFVATVATVGTWFLGSSQAGGGVHWQQAWLVTVPLFGATILCNVIYSFLEGLGLVHEVALGRLLQSVVSMIGLWLALTLGCELMSLAILHGLNLLIAMTWILWRHHHLLSSLLQARAAVGAVDWGTEIWPFQWRIAVSWVAGYFGSLAITPIVFHTMGAVDAGRVGLSITLMGIAASAALAWITTKSPSFGALAARRQFDLSWQLFRRAELQAMNIALLLTTSITLAVMLLAHYWPTLGARFLPFWPLACLGGAAVLSVYISARAIYLRAFRREPFMVMSVVTGLGTAGSAWLALVFGGISWMTVSYILVSAAIAFLWCRPVFNRLRVEFTNI